MKARFDMAGYMPKAKTVEWSTPDFFFALLDREFHFTLDPCATAENAKCAKYYTAEQDGLAQEWLGESVYVNPPYGRALGQWVKKAYLQGRFSSYPVVVLVPVRSDTKWWHEYAMQADEIRFVRGRLKFGGGKQSSTFPSAALIFRDRTNSMHRGQAGPYVCSY